MPYLSEFTEYKRRIANLIVNDELCVELITGKKNTPLPAASLIGRNVYLYDYIDDTIKDAMVLICIEVDEGYYTSPTARDFDLHIYVSVHKSLMNYVDDDGKGQIRRDMICSRIDAMLSNSTDFGFQKVKGEKGYRIIFSNDFRTKDMVYRIKDWNVSGNGLDRDTYK